MGKLTKHLSLLLLSLATAGAPWPVIAATANPVVQPEAEEDFQAIFNGKDLTGWVGDTNLWRVRDGMIVGKSPGIDHNEFLSTKSEYGDFELRLSFRVVGGVGDSGVQFRSSRIPQSPQVSGYQADILDGYWSSVWDEARRDRFLAEADQAEVSKVLKKDGWNDYVIRCQGDHVEVWFNGLKTVDYHETDPSIPRSGIIALQTHSGKPQEIQFKNLQLKKL